MTLGARLRARYPEAMDRSTGRPDGVLPIESCNEPGTQRSGGPRPDLQYAGPEVLDRVPLLHQSPGAGSEVHVREFADRLVGAAVDDAGPGSVVGAPARRLPAIAIEEPGYPTIMDAYERAGARAFGSRSTTTGHFLIPWIRLPRRRHMALLTPRAHNPTGATWSRPAVRPSPRSSPRTLASIAWRTTPSPRRAESRITALESRCRRSRHLHPIVLEAHCAGPAHRCRRRPPATPVHAGRGQELQRWMDLAPVAENTGHGADETKRWASSCPGRERPTAKRRTRAADAINLARSHGAGTPGADRTA